MFRKTQPDKTVHEYSQFYVYTDSYVWIKHSKTSVPEKLKTYYLMWGLG
jgi:hypothetical protein